MSELLKQFHQHHAKATNYDRLEQRCAVKLRPTFFHESPMISFLVSAKGTTPIKSLKYEESIKLL